MYPRSNRLWGCDFFSYMEFEKRRLFSLYTKTPSGGTCFIHIRFFTKNKTECNDFLYCLLKTSLFYAIIN